MKKKNRNENCIYIREHQVEHADHDFCTNPKVLSAYRESLKNKIRCIKNNICKHIVMKKDNVSKI